jgi:hypothetical protein
MCNVDRSGGDDGRSIDIRAISVVVTDEDRSSTEVHLTAITRIHLVNSHKTIDTQPIQSSSARYLPRSFVER